MTKILSRTLLVSALITLSCAEDPAFADYLQTYVATTCDAKSGRGMVRFGYGDADGPSKFVEASPAIDGGLSALPVTNADMAEAVCSLPPDREIKVRYDNSLEKWSVWVDKIRIAQGEERDEFPFGVIVEPNGFRKCRFHLAENQWAYDLTPAVLPGRARPTPIECDKTLSSINGPRDPIEYPMPHSQPALRQGSMLVKHATDFRLCQSMIEKGNHQYTNLSNGDDRIEGSHVGTVTSETQWDGLTYLHPGVPGDTEQVEMQHLDLTNTGVVRPVYKVGSGHTFTHTFFVIPPATVSLEQVTTELSVEQQFGEIPAIARRKGWLVLGWDIPPYHTTPFEFSVIQAAKATYLLGSSESDASSQSDMNPTAVLWKGLANGTLKQLCVFQIVKPHL